MKGKGKSKGMGSGARKMLQSGGKSAPRILGGKAPPQPIGKALARGRMPKGKSSPG